MKGFLFSIEALITIILLISTITIIWTYFDYNYNTNFLTTNSKINTINAFYFNDYSKSTANDSNLNINFCSKIIIYNNQKEFEEKTFCEGIK